MHYRPTSLTSGGLFTYLSSWIQVRRMTFWGFLTSLPRPPSFSFLSHFFRPTEGLSTPKVTHNPRPLTHSPTNHTQLHSRLTSSDDRFLEPSVTTAQRSWQSATERRRWSESSPAESPRTGPRAFLARFTARFVAAKLHFYDSVTSQSECSGWHVLKKAKYRGGAALWLEF